MRIEFVINSADGDALASLREEVARLRSEGHVVRARVTFDAGDASQFASEAVVAGADVVIAAGGDGTVNEVVNGLLGPNAMAANDLPRLGIVPLGTGNDFAAFREIPEDVKDAVAVAVSGSEAVVDVAAVNGRLFMNVSSGGLGAEATEETSDRSKRLLGSLAYLLTGIRKFASLSPLEGKFIAGNEVLFDGRFLFFAVGNAGRTGGGVWVTPDADIADGLLDVCIVEDLDHAEFVRMLPDLRSGAHVNNGHVIYRKVPRLTVEPVGELSVNVDGEPIDGSIFNYSVRRSALRVAGGPGSRA